MAYQVVQIFYWLSLAAWFGGVLFVVMAAPIVFRTVREANPVLPHVLAVNLEGQHSTMLAGTIVGRLLTRLVTVGLGCAGIIFLMMIGQLFVIDLEGSNQTAAIFRAILLVAAAALEFYDWKILWPRIESFRKEYVEHADEPEIANPAKDQFDALHRRSVTMFSILLFLLLGIVLFSANISPKKSYAPQAAPKAE